MSKVLLQVINLSKSYKDKNYWLNRKSVASSHIVRLPDEPKVSENSP